MGVFDTYIAQYHSEVKPHIMDAAHRSRWYAEQILHRLTCIHREMVTDRDPGENRGVQILLPADASRAFVATVPAGEEFVLEVFALDTAVTARLFSDGAFRVMTGTYLTQSMPPVRFVGPCTVEAALTAAGTAVNGYVQLRRLARRARPTQSGGMVETGLDSVDALREHDPLHAGVGIG